MKKIKIISQSGSNVCERTYEDLVDAVKSAYKIVIAKDKEYARLYTVVDENGFSLINQLGQVHSVCNTSDRLIRCYELYLVEV